MDLSCRHWIHQGIIKDSPLWLVRIWTSSWCMWALVIVQLTNPQSIFCLALLEYLTGLVFSKDSKGLLCRILEPFLSAWLTSVEIRLQLTDTSASPISNFCPLNLARLLGTKTKCFLFSVHNSKTTGMIVGLSLFYSLFLVITVLFFPIVQSLNTVYFIYFVLFSSFFFFNRQQEVKSNPCYSIMHGSRRSYFIL